MASEFLHPPHRIEDALALIGLDARMGGRLGWNEPPPPAMTPTFASIVTFTSVVARKPPASSLSRLETMRLKLKVGLNGAICSISRSTRPCAETEGNAQMS